VLTFKTHDPSHEPETNPIKKTLKNNKVKFQIIKILRDEIKKNKKILKQNK